MILETVPNTCSLHEGRGNYLGKEIDVEDIKGLNLYLYYCSDRETALNESYKLSGKTLEIIENNFTSRHNLIKSLSENNVHFCEANRQLYNYINYIYDKYPDAKFIHLIRNGYDCVRSWFPRGGAYPESLSLYDLYDRSDISFKKRLKLFKSFSLKSKEQNKSSIENLSNKKYLDEEDTRRLCSQNSYYQYDKPLPYANDKWANQWEGFDRIQKISWFWQYTNSLITERLKQIPSSQSMVLRLEDISPEKIREVLRFAELPELFSIEAIKAHDRRDSSSFEWIDEWDGWTKEKVNKFNGIAGNCMDQFGYKLRL